MYIPHYRPRRRRQHPRDADCYVLRQSDFPSGCWAPLGADWSADVTLRHRVAGLLDRGDQVTEHRMLVLRVGFELGIKHKPHGHLQRFTLVSDGPRLSPQCPRCSRCMRGLWMPRWLDILQCRQCQNIRYTSQTRNSNRYHVEAARLVEQEIHDHPERLELLEPKLHEHAEHDSFISNAQFLAKLGRGRLARLMRQGVPGFDLTLQRLRA